MVVGNWRAARLREMTSSVPSVMSGSGGCGTRGLGNGSRCFLTTTLRHCARGGSPNFRGGPQASSTDIQDGQNAEVSVRERLGRVYTGKIIRNLMHSMRQLEPSGQRCGSTNGMILSCRACMPRSNLLFPLRRAQSRTDSADPRSCRLDDRWPWGRLLADWG